MFVRVAVDFEILQHLATFALALAQAERTGAGRLAAVSVAEADADVVSPHRSGLLCFSVTCAVRRGADPSVMQ